eukprot:504269_1
MPKHQRASLLLVAGLTAATAVSGQSSQGLRGQNNGGSSHEGLRGHISDIAINSDNGGSTRHEVVGVRFIVAALDEKERTSTKCLAEVDAFLDFLDGVSDISLGGTHDLTFYEGECDRDAMVKHVESSSINGPLSSGNHSRDVKVILFNVDRREALSCHNALRTIYSDMEHWNLRDLEGVSAIDVDYGECESEIQELSCMMKY